MPKGKYKRHKAKRNSYGKRAALSRRLAAYSMLMIQRTEIDAKIEKLKKGF